MWNPTDFEALADLFYKADGSRTSFSSTEFEGASAAGNVTSSPASIGPKYEPKKKTAIEEAIEAGEHDSRSQPEYEFIYKQAVTPNDVYLQMSEKTPSTIFCEELVMKIKLPDTECASDIKLDVKPSYLKLTSPLYYLATYLPHKVNDTKSCAKWDSLTSTLILTMPILDRNILD